MECKIYEFDKRGMQMLLSDKISRCPIIENRFYNKYNKNYKILCKFYLKRNQACPFVKCIKETVVVGTNVQYGEYEVLY